MSSIYKKGRDGYYYYQTYVYNPESKKKNKRIFHALGTKDFEEAKAKQKELDLHHEGLESTSSKSSRILNNVILTKPSYILLGFACSIYFLFNFLKVDKKKYNSKSIVYSKSGIVSNKNNQPFIKITKSKNPAPKEKEYSEQIILPKELVNKSKEDVKKLEIPIPKYNIERVDTLYGAFNQGKIYATINKESSDESQRLLCKTLAKNYSVFSNIVICLYSNNNTGKRLAKGDYELTSLDQQKDCWLAMYTYNSVEGEYFDNNPGIYLGNY